MHSGRVKLSPNAFDCEEIDREIHSLVKKKLDDALKTRLDEIEAKRDAEKMRRNALKTSKKHHKGKYKHKVVKPIDYYPKKKKKTLSQEERAFHEAYQILLFTYPKIIKQRKKHLKPP